MIETATPPLDPDFLPLPLQLEQEVAWYSKSASIRWILRYAMQGADAGLKAADVIKQAGKIHPPSADITAAEQVGRQLATSEALTPGDSRTLLIGTRMLLYLTDQADREIILTPMQQRRNVEDDPTIPTWDLADMLKLSGGTTQWASMAILLQDREWDEIQALRQNLSPEHRYMIDQTIKIKQRWVRNRSCGRPFELTNEDRDFTLLRQAQHHYTRLVTGENLPFAPWHSEHVPYAVMNGHMTIEEATEQFPMLTRHETNRLEETVRVMDSPVINTLDHRMGYSAAMSRHSPRWTVRSKRAAKKSWPQAPRYIELAPEFAKAA